MSHMPSLGGSGSACDTNNCGGPRLVTYTATGSEGTDFTVSIGATLASDDYSVGLFSFESLTNVPLCTFPNNDHTAGNRTTTQFRVVTAAVLTAGDILLFEIVEN